MSMYTLRCRGIAAVILALAALCAVTTLAQAQELAPVAGQFQDTEHGIAFTPPPGWMQMRNGLPQGAVCVFIGPRTDGFAANINMTVVPTPPEMSPTAPLPASAAEEIAKMLRKTYPGYTVAGTSRVRVAGEDALAIANTFTTKKPKTSLRNRQILIVRGGKLYTFTFTANARAFKTVAPVFEQVMKTVQWLPAQPPAP